MQNACFDLKRGRNRHLFLSELVSMIRGQITVNVDLCRVFSTSIRVGKASFNSLTMSGNEAFLGMGRHAGLPLQQANVFLRSRQTHRSSPTTGERVPQIRADTQVCSYDRRMYSSDQGRHTGLPLQQANVFLRSGQTHRSVPTTGECIPHPAPNCVDWLLYNQ